MDIWTQLVNLPFISKQEEDIVWRVDGSLVKKPEEDSDSGGEEGPLGQFQIEPLEEVGEGDFHFKTGGFFKLSFFTYLNLQV